MESATGAGDPHWQVFVAESAGTVLAYAVCRIADRPDDGLVRPRVIATAPGSPGPQPAPLDTPMKSRAKSAKLRGRRPMMSATAVVVKSPQLVE